MWSGCVNWIRVAVGIADDPDVHRLAETLGVRVAEAVGLLVGCLARFPEHAPEGDLRRVPATLVERWAGWEGERGVFDAALRETFLNADGVWESWNKHNGTALKKLERDRERLRQQREERADVMAKLAGVSRDSSASVAGTDGRTDELPKWGRKRGKYEELAPYKPEPFCKHCGGGMGKKQETDTRLTIIHREDCPDAKA